MTTPTFGIDIQVVAEQSRPPIYSDMSIVGLVGTAPDADEDMYPLNTPVHIFSNDTASQVGLGLTGTLLDAVQGVNDQLGEFEVAARVVVVRTAVGVDDAATLANVLGTEEANTGIYALLSAGHLLGAIPRLIGVPGFTATHDVVPGTINVTSGVKGGGNTGNGTLTLVSGAGAHGVGVQAGTYQVRATGGTFSATAAPKTGGNTGNGVLTMANPSTGSGAVVGAYRATCIAAAANGGTFLVEDPSGTTIGIATVGTPFAGAIAFTIADGSADFVVGDAFVFTVVAAIPANGGVFSVKDPLGVERGPATVGTPYTGQINFTIADGSTDFIIGDGFDVVVVITAGDSLENPICAALPSILDKLLGVAVVDGPATNLTDYTNWRETISSKRIIPLETAVLVGISPTQKPGSPRVLGQMVATDFEHGGRPFHSSANRAITSIVGPSRFINFSLTDGATEGQAILAENGGIIVRGEMGVENVIASAGFVYIGTDTCSEDPLWTFYNEVRGRDFIHLAFLRNLRFYLGRFNIDGQAIQAVLNSMNTILRDLKANNDILGYRVSFTKDENSPDELRLGHFHIDFAAEEPPVLRFLGIKSARYLPALDALMTDLIAQVDTTAAAIAA